MICHDSGVIHRDLKLENVLFSTTAHRKVKVVDFGIAGMCKVAKENKMMLELFAT